MKRFSIKLMSLLLAICLAFTACEKQLDIKPNKQLLTPEKLSDLQAMLDYTPIMVVDPPAGEASSDDYFLPDASFNSFTDMGLRNLYTYQKDHFFNGPNSDWGVGYAKVYYCNVALETIANIEKTPENASAWNSIKGQALFKRSFAFWYIADIWSTPYDVATESTDLGIPLRLNANFQEQSIRSTVRQTYAQIINDLKTCLLLLPVNQIHTIRPAKSAAYAMLSRVYLSIRNYEEAKRYADSALMLNNNLMDYNVFNTNLNYTFTQNNPETIFFSLSGNSLTGVANARMDTTLYALYPASDCRKTLFFRSRPNGLFSFKGSYANSDGLFSGLAVDELYLTRAECNARAGNITDALTDLNTLLIKRFKTNQFVPVTAGNTADALSKILMERRKELIMRFIRWSDVKRMNKEDAGIILKRLVNGQYYILMPNSPRYALPIPEDVIAISGMPQNPR